ncbi:hypothetical protein DICVIV_11747 [Dictyocaulus viviparus]|uniref:Uncharacterized protein n=1 Tax=Dictyocaulus viviparus TaxID=29172 RepID=A0A0D8XF10_DICVI|nr:hypothetical protein DICVIV_11747 [Dictyocaulus viviparus]
MSESLLDSYNPLYDVHLRQYFALPHMQKHLRRMGLIDRPIEPGDEVYANHHEMMDMMLKNREVQLMKMAELKRKLDAAEKVGICRRIRSGQSPEFSQRRQSLSTKQRRYSNCADDKEIVQKIESEHVQPINYYSKNPYIRLSISSIHGLKSRQSPKSGVVNDSYHTRTSCPPTTRKRKESSSKLPQIGGNKATKSKSFSAQSHTLSNTTPICQKPPIDRGRTSTKTASTTIPKTNDTATHIASSQKNGVQIQETPQSAVNEKRPEVAVIENTRENISGDGQSVEVPLSMPKQNELVSEMDSMNDREGTSDNKTYIEKSEELETHDNNNVIKENKSLESTEAEKIVEARLSTERDEFDEGDLSEAVHYKHDNEELLDSDNEFTNRPEHSYCSSADDKGDMESIISHETKGYPSNDAAPRIQPGDLDGSKIEEAEKELIHKAWICILI